MAKISVKKKGLPKYHAIAFNPLGVILHTRYGNERIVVMEKAKTILKKPNITKVKVWEMGPRGGFTLLKTLKPISRSGRLLVGGKLRSQKRGSVLK